MSNIKTIKAWKYFHSIGIHIRPGVMCTTISVFVKGNGGTNVQLQRNKGNKASIQEIVLLFLLFT